MPLCYDDGATTPAERDQTAARVGPSVSVLTDRSLAPGSALDQPRITRRRSRLAAGHCAFVS